MREDSLSSPEPVRVPVLRLEQGMYSNTAKFYGYFYNGAAEAARRSHFILPLLGPGPAKVIDVAAGVGDLAWPLAEEGHQVLCFEESDAMFAVLLERCNARKDIRHLLSPFPTNLADCPILLRADAAVAANLFSHLGELEKIALIRQIHRQLVPGGTLVFNCVQKTPFRPEQPLSEINKRVFGETVIRHFASSLSIEGGNRQAVHFEYRMEHQGQPACVMADEFILSMDRPERMAEILTSEGFCEIRFFGSYDGGPPHPDLPGFVVVASRVP